MATQGFTVEDALAHIGFGKTQYIMFFFVGVAWAGDGMEAMLLSYLGPELKCKWDLSPAQESWITSAVFIGMMLGSYTWGAISDKYGRKIGYFAPAAFTALFGLLSGLAPNYGFLLFFRGCVGFGIAGAHVAYTLFMEYVAPKHRGVCMSLIEGFWTLGSIFLAGMAWLLLPSLGWRALVFAASAPLFVLVALYPFLKESPHWLLANGRTEDALEVLEWAARMNGKQLPSGSLVHHSHKHPSKAEAAHIQPALQLDDSVTEPADVQLGPQAGTEVDTGAAGMEKEKLTCTAHAEAFLTNIGHSLQQMVHNRELATTSTLLLVIWMSVALVYYGIILLGVEVFAEANEECDGDTAQISSGDFQDVFIASLGEVGGLVTCVLLIDIWGRRRCLWLFILLTSIFLAPLLRPDGPTTDGETTALDVACVFGTRMFAYAAFIAIFIYTPEIYPTKIRSFAFGLFNAMSRLGGLTAPFVAVDLLESSGIRPAAAVLMGSSIIAAIFGMFLPIETMGRDLPEDVDEVHQQVEKTHKPTAKGGTEGEVEMLGTGDHQSGVQSNPFMVDLEANSEAQHDAPNATEDLDQS